MWKENVGLILHTFVDWSPFNTRWKKLRPSGKRHSRHCLWLSTTPWCKSFGIAPRLLNMGTRGMYHCQVPAALFQERIFETRSVGGLYGFL